MSQDQLDVSTDDEIDVEFLEAEKAPATTPNVVCIICCCKKNKSKQITFHLDLSLRTFLIYMSAFCHEHFASSCVLLTGLFLSGT